MKIILDLSTDTLSYNEIKATLNKQLLRCLVYLCQHPDTVVTKEMLLEECWKKRGIIVSDNAVRQTIFRLRRLLLDLGVQENIIVSVGKTGYQLAEGKIHCINEPAISPGGDKDDLQRITADETERSFRKNEDNSVSSSRYIHQVKGISVKFIVWVGVTGLLFFAVTALLRLNSVITTVNYTEFSARNGRTYFSHSPPAFSIPTKVAQIESRLAENNIPVSRSHYIYLNDSSDRLLNMFVCDQRIERPDNHCLNFTVIGTEK